MTTANFTPRTASTDDDQAWMKPMEADLAWRLLDEPPKHSDSVEWQTDEAWRLRRLELLDQDPAFCRIIDEQIPYEHLHGARGIVRGFPRHGLKL